MKMLNCTKIVEIALDNDLNIDYRLEEEYYKTLEYISVDKKHLSKLIKELEKNVEQINEKNIFKIINLIDSVINENEYCNKQIYDFLLILLYIKCCINVSVPYRIVRIMILIEKNLDKIFKDILKKTSEYDITSVIITLNALYSPLGKLQEIDERLVIELLEKVKKSINNNESELLKNTIQQQLYERINNNRYQKYYKELRMLIS